MKSALPALVILALAVAFFTLDHYVLHWNSLVFLGKQLERITWWMAFWR